MDGVFPDRSDPDHSSIGLAGADGDRREAQVGYFTATGIVIGSRPARGRPARLRR